MQPLVMEAKSKPEVSCGKSQGPLGTAAPIYAILKNLVEFTLRSKVLVQKPPRKSKQMTKRGENMQQAKASWRTFQKMRDCHIAAISGHVKTQESQDSPWGIAFSAHLFSGART